MSTGKQANAVQTACYAGAIVAFVETNRSVLEMKRISIVFIFPVCFKAFVNCWIIVSCLDVNCAGFALGLFVEMLIRTGGFLIRCVSVSKGR